ncbi:hypothetical protein [uncultured Tessaracoccus sp.]|uniref:hypothetical protein n=1 Tax=uncultured Tessaracoccus sp. TaxID=905023 RepID=UPI00261D80C5|nr:hypothetical protein [uncultured Tessaracoccus sp.]
MANEPQHTPSEGSRPGLGDDHSFAQFVGHDRSLMAAMDLALSTLAGQAKDPQLAERIELAREGRLGFAELLEHRAFREEFNTGAERTEDRVASARGAMSEEEREELNTRARQMHERLTSSGATGEAVRQALQAFER